MTLYWLSFADDDGCRGVAMIYSDSFMSAVIESHLLGINPGGEVSGIPIPDDVRPSDKWIGRLLTPAEAHELNDEMDPC